MLRLVLQKREEEASSSLDVERKQRELEAIAAKTLKEEAELAKQSKVELQVSKVNPYYSLLETRAWSHHIVSSRLRWRS